MIAEVAAQGKVKYRRSRPRHVCLSIYQQLLTILEDQVEDITRFGAGRGRVSLSLSRNLNIPPSSGRRALCTRPLRRRGNQYILEFELVGLTLTLEIASLKRLSAPRRSFVRSWMARRLSSGICDLFTESDDATSAIGGEIRPQRQE
ncbi:hypothetical protein PSTT_14102 [Puccinia striiformis]|uniref:Uncharacterized protein n=2 Tax=Puccinia striiformis TaxID=27350 RepID=A0A0L0W281_9BASI|nr:hypothetical protein PSTG_01386 [Puccinia striiformis f. sp. tritici PST-78]POV98957.1 hypothetical protein PSTT_14102 [Puccinia striiformis]